MIISLELTRSKELNMKILKPANIVSDSIDHIKTSRMGYFHHLLHAAKFGFQMIYLGLTSLVHALVPTWFKGDAPLGIANIFYRTVYHHPNPEFQKHIQAERTAAE